MEVHHVTLFGVQVWTDALLWMCVWPTLVIMGLLAVARRERRK